MKSKKKVYFLLILFILGLPSATASSPNLQFDFISFIKNAYNAYNRIKNFLEPEPGLADLITQAKNEIINEINEVRVEEQIGNVNALIDEYTIYLNNPPSQPTIEAWIRDAINVVNQFELIIQNKSPRLAYLSAKAYNMLIPLMALMMQRQNIRVEDILPLFRDMINTNRVLIGNYCWDELPNAPLYWDRIYSDSGYVGKLLKCYHDGTIGWPEYLTTYDIIWTANEEVRKYLIDHYQDVWYYISNETGVVTHPISPADNKYLCANVLPYRTQTPIAIADLQPGDTDFFWKLEFQTAHLVKIVHWSGKALALTPDKHGIVLTTALASQATIWSFNALYHDRPGLVPNSDSYLCLTAFADSVYVAPIGYKFSPSQRWIVQFADRKAFGIGTTVFPCPADYDGDGKADISLKTNDGRWLIDFADNGFGSWDQVITGLANLDNHAQPAPADYDGDGIADICIKQDATGSWNIDFASNGFGSWDFTRKIGSPNAVRNYYAVPADFDGDGKADIALFSSSGGWSIDYSSNGFTGWDTYPHGWQVYYPNQDIYPAAADYDGDGKADVSIKQDNAGWFIDFASNNFVWTNEWDWSGASNYYGDETVLPVPGYYNQDNVADIAVRADNGQWMMWDIASGTPNLIHFTGIPDKGAGKHAIPVPADYDGDGLTDISVLTEDGQWLIDYSKNGFQINENWDWSSTISFETAVATPHSSQESPISSISDYQLANYPNPFNAETTISFRLPKAAEVSIKIYNICGHEIKSIFNRKLPGGYHKLTWDGSDNFGTIVPGGIYLIYFSTQGFRKSIKCLLLK